MLEGLKKFIIGDDSNFSEQKYSIEDAAAHVERFYNKFKEIVGRNSDYISESVVDLMRLAQQQNIRIDKLEATNSLLIERLDKLEATNSLLIERLDKLEAKGTLEQDKVSHENNLTEVEKLQMLLKG
jgi:uncharacterized coiled-coil protein SlyX